MRVTVIGAGIMGLCTAWALSEEGHQVTVLEQGAVPNPLGSSVDAHRLIRFAYGREDGYARMVAEAYRDWERLWRFLGRRLYVPTGTLVLGIDDPSSVREASESFDRLRIAYELPNAGQLEQRFPAIRSEAVSAAFYTPSGGVLLARDIMEALWHRLAAAGVMLRPGTRVRALDPQSGRADLADGTVVDGDAAIVTAGPWLSHLLPEFAPRAVPSRQTIAYLRPPADMQAAWRGCPMVLERGGQIRFYVVPPVLETPLKIGDHGFTMTGDPDEDRDLAADEARRLTTGVRHRLCGFERYRAMGGRICFYTVSPEERFVVEPVGRCWVATGFSGHGFKFGPTIGRTLAGAVSGHRPASEISAWAAGRAPGGSALFA